MVMGDTFLNLVSDDSTNSTYGYSTIYDVPESVANYTDGRGVSHPLWAKPFFDREYNTFDEVYNRPADKPSNYVPTNKDLYEQFKVAALCLQNCYENGYKYLSAPTDDQITAYYDCKLKCYKAELKTLK
jgi:hypothetical protein